MPDEGKAALEDPKAEASEVVPTEKLSPEEADRLTILRGLRPAIRGLVSTVPYMMSQAFNDPKFRLTDDEEREGVKAWETALNVLCPDVMKASKALVLLNLGCWHVNVYLPRLGRIREIKKRRRLARQQPAPDSDAPDATDAPAEAASEGPAEQEPGL